MNEREECHCYREFEHGDHDWNRILGGEMHCPGWKGDGTDVVVGEAPRITKINGRRVS